MWPQGPQQGSHQQEGEQRLGEPLLPQPLGRLALPPSRPGEQLSHCAQSPPVQTAVLLPSHPAAPGPETSAARLGVSTVVARV